MEVLQILFVSLPFVAALTLALGLIVAGGLVLDRPWVPLALYMAVFFAFSQSSYGSKEVFVSAPVYSRGTGQLFFPILYWGLLAVLAWTWMGRAFAKVRPVPVPAVGWWLIAWIGLLVGHVTVAMFAGYDAADALGTQGFVGVAWMAPLILLMCWAAGGRRPMPLLLFARFLVLAALAKAGYGLVRWGFLGGDPANIYANAERLDVKLTYFDIADGLTCILGGAVALSLLVVKRDERRTLYWDIVYGVTVLAVLACVVLSYRRTAWGGVVLVALLFLWRIPPKWRVPALLIGAPTLMLALGGVMAQRLAWREGNSLERFFFDLTPSRMGFEGTRMLELRLAWEAFLDSPIVGIGSWGRYASSNLIPWQDPASAGGFLHSGLLHLGMKTGLVGLLLLAGLLWAFVRQVGSVGPQSSAPARALTLAGAAGLLFMLPDFLFGTPIPQVRTMQLLGFCLGLPCMAAIAVSAAHPRAVFFQGLQRPPTRVAWPVQPTA